MRQEELAEKVALRAGVPAVETKLILKCLYEEILNALISGEQTVCLGSFGRFKLLEYKSRYYRDRYHKQMIPCRGRMVARFYESERTKERLIEAFPEIGKDMPEKPEFKS